MKFDSIIRKTQKELKLSAVSELYGLGYTVLSEKGYVYAKGDVPVMLVAHLDTVHNSPVKTSCYSSGGGIVMSPEGIGGDDRCGVYMILEIARKHKCHILFCEDEEVGATGARAFASSGISPEINFIVELDRRGSNDAVFYSCDNPEFTKFVCGFGFEEAQGSFSDISVVAPALGVAAVNISAGYYNEHTKYEHVDFAVMKNNISRVGKLVSSTLLAKPFEYIESLRHTFAYYPWRSAMNKFDSFGYDYSWPDNSVEFNNWPCPEEESDNKLLMFLDDTDYINGPDGIVFEAAYNYAIDLDGNVYAYDWNYDVAVKKGDFIAVGELGIRVLFDSKKSVSCDVLSAEELAMLYEDDYICEEVND